jgi:hypothetical protein
MKPGSLPANRTNIARMKTTKQQSTGGSREQTLMTIPGLQKRQVTFMMLSSERGSLRYVYVDG